MDQKNRFTAETVRQVQQALDEVTPYQATELSKQQAIRALSPQIFALRSKGYSLMSIAAMLSEHGVPVSVAALRTYLRRVHDEATDEEPWIKAKRSRQGRVVAPPPEPPLPNVPTPSQAREALAATSPQQDASAPASGAAARRETAPASGRTQEPRRSAFTVRPDGRDI